MAGSGSGNTFRVATHKIKCDCGNYKVGVERGSENSILKLRDILDIEEHCLCTNRRSC